MKKRITIKDIAEVAGVSFKTVSRVINKESGVRDKTKLKVEKVLEEYNYISNFFAKNLRKKSSHTIIVSIKKFNEWSSILLKNIIEVAKEYKYEIVIDSFEKNTMNTSLIESDYIDGAIIFDAFEDDIRIKTLNKLNIPLIIVGKHSQETYVTSDNFSGGYMATKYLLEKGFKDIYFILGPLKGKTNEDRLDGYKRAHTEQKIDIKKENIYLNISSYEKVYSLVKNMIEKKNLPEAFFISGDERTLGAIRALGEANLKIPEDISIIGFDDIPLASYLHPALTTIKQDLNTLGKEIFLKLYQKINGREVTSLELPVKLIERKST